MNLARSADVEAPHGDSAQATPTPRTAVVGLGPMGLRHLRALAALGWPVVGVADRRDDRFAHAHEIVPGAPVFDDVTRMLAEARPELVVIATNGPSHAALTLAALEAGARWVPSATHSPRGSSAARSSSLAGAAAVAGASSAPISST